MNRVIIITGTRKGIGFSLANYFLDYGDYVVGCSRRTSTINHDNYTHYCLDVSNEQDVIKMIRDVYKAYKKIDILINNAGIASMNHFLLTPQSIVKKLIDTNFIGTFLMCREVAKYMLKNKYGRIVNFSTVAVPLNLEGELIYSSSKAAVEQLTKVMAAELGSHGVTVNAIGPTPISTDLIKNVPVNKINNIIQKQSIKRLGTFDDIANIINFLISQNSSFITGQIIYLGGIN